MSTLTPWQKTQVARHPQRPHCLDYIAALITDFVPLAGDRKLRRGSGDRRRLRPFPRRERLHHRPRKRLRYRQPAQAQFRHGAAGRLPQGGAADGHGRPLRYSGHRADRYRGRLSGHRRRRARPGRGHRALDRSVPAHRRSQCRDHHRRRRLRRRHRDRDRQPRDHAGARHLQRDLAGRRGLDPLARYGESAGGRVQHEDHRAGSGAVRRRRCDRARTDRRRAPRPRRGHRSGRRGHRRPRLAELRGLDRATIVRLRREKFMAIGRTLADFRLHGRVRATISPRFAPAASPHRPARSAAGSG